MNSAHLSRLADAIADVICAWKGITHEVWFAVLFKALAPWERKYKAMLARVWDEERRIVIANLKKLKAHHGKAPDNLIDSILYPKKKFIEVLSKETASILVGLIEAEGTRVLDVLDLDMAFDVTNPNVTRWIADYAPKFSDALEKVNTDLLRTTLAEGMEAGETIPELMARVNSTFAEFDRYRAEMIARSETSRASNQAALESYRQSGVVTRKVWMVAPDCCDICAALDGKVVGIDEEFFDDDYGDGSGPPLHPNCVLPGTRCITPGGLVAGIRAWYRGEAIELTFANGTRLAVTPNHMLLTPDGFASAELLREGDDVFYCPGFEGMLASHPYDNGHPSLVEEIVGTLAESSGVASRSMPVTPEYLHGDGRLCDGNVDVIWANSLLKNASKAALGQPLAAQRFNAANADTASLPGLRSLASLLKRAGDTADGLVGGVRKSSAFFRARLGHTEEHGFAPIAGLDAGVKQAAAEERTHYSESMGNGKLGDPGGIQSDGGFDIDRLAALGACAGLDKYASRSQIHSDAVPVDANLPRDIIEGQAGLIETTRIVKIVRLRFDGQVYDLQTLPSLYISNGIVSSNCRCAIAADID